MTEHRRRMGEVRAVTEDNGEHMVTMHIIRPNVVDDYGSVWNPHAFDDSLAERLPTMTWSHNWSEPIGRAVDYRTSDEGPEPIFRFDDFDDVPTARRAFSQVQSGTIDDCSVGFSNVQRRDPTPDELARWPGMTEWIEKADLDEVALVLRGAVPGAKVLSIRSAGGSVEDSVLDAIARKVAAGELSEEEGKIALRLAADDGSGSGDAGVPPPEPDTDLEADVLAAEEVLDRQ